MLSLHLLSCIEYSLLRNGSASPVSLENTFSILESSSLLFVEAQPDKRHSNKNRSVLEWKDRHIAYMGVGSGEQEGPCPSPDIYT